MYTSRDGRAEIDHRTSRAMCCSEQNRLKQDACVYRPLTGRACANRAITFWRHYPYRTEPRFARGRALQGLMGVVTQWRAIQSGTRVPPSGGSLRRCVSFLRVAYRCSLFRRNGGTKGGVCSGRPCCWHDESLARMICHFRAECAEPRQQDERERRGGSRYSKYWWLSGNCAGQAPCRRVSVGQLNTHTAARKSVFRSAGQYRRQVDMVGRPIRGVYRLINSSAGRSREI